MAEPGTSPLAGKRVVITRPLKSSLALAESLRAAGAEVLQLPLIQIEPPQDVAALDGALQSISRYDWLIFTSQNALAAVSERLAVFPKACRPETLRVAAVGIATQEAAREAGFKSVHTGRGRNAADLVSELSAELKGKRVLLPRSDRGAPELLDQLRDVGAKVLEVIAYRTVSLDYQADNISVEIKTADAFLFFSPSAVEAFRSLVNSGVLSSATASGARGAIGPVTAAALTQAGLRCDFQAARPSATEVIAALAAHFERSRKVTVPGMASQ